MEGCRITVAQHHMSTTLTSFIAASAILIDQRDTELGTYANVFQTVSRPNSTLLSDVYCKDCDRLVGVHDANENSHRLYKSRLTVHDSSMQGPQSFPASTFICAQLLTLIETSAIRRVVVYTDSESEISGILLWMFNPDIYYSSSKKGAKAYRAMKVFYKHIEKPLKVLEENSNTMEELLLPQLDMNEFQESLRQSTNVLPQSARTFQDWQVGLVDRYERSATGQGVMDENPLTRKAGNMSDLPEGMEELYV